MKILSFLLKSADSQVLFLLRPRGRYEAITEKIARIANPALHSSLVLPIIIVSFPKEIFLYLYVSPSACCVTTWLSVVAFHSVVLHCVITAAATQSVLPEQLRNSISCQKITENFRWIQITVPISILIPSAMLSTLQRLWEGCMTSILSNDISEHSKYLKE